MKTLGSYHSIGQFNVHLVAHEYPEWRSRIICRPASKTMYPLIEPYEVDRWTSGTGHDPLRACRDAGAKPAVFLHGGREAGSIPTTDASSIRAATDLRFCVDQRGCGSLDPYASFEANTTWHLVADLERLRQYMGVETWLVLGGSWESSLAWLTRNPSPKRVSGN